MNTRLNYIYGDASNNKTFNTCVVAGELSDEQAKTIMASLDQGEYFIPAQVELPVERFSEVTEDDHCWCELEDGFYELVDSSPTEDISVESLTAAFAAAKGNWDDVKYAVC